MYSKRFLTPDGSEPEAIPSEYSGKVAVNDGFAQLTVSFPSSATAFAMVRSPAQNATNSIACVNSFYWHIFKDMRIMFNENSYNWAFDSFIEYGAGFEMIGARIENGSY